MIISPPDISWLAILPVLIVTGTAFLVIAGDLWSEGPDREALGWIGIVGLVAAAISCLTLWNTEATSFAGAVTLDRFGLFFTVLFCVASGLTLLMSMSYLELTDIKTGDYYSLIVLATAGMILMAITTDLIALFVALEIMSIAAYALAGIWREQRRANEAALKYFLLGAFASGFLLFGMALLYGATGSTVLTVISAQLPKLGADQHLLATVGMGLLLVGFAFKIAVAPFHVWAPDVYEGAPTAVSGFMAVGIKAAGFAAFVRVFMHTLQPFAVDWAGLLWILAVLTMTVGNVTALLQHNIKRMLAYSSVAHAGYLLVGMIAAGDDGGAAVLFYLISYTFMTLGAFAVVIALGRRGAANEDLDDYNGVGFRSPFLGAAMTVFMLSLAGVPPLAGFIGKFYLFGAAVKAGYIGLAVIGVLNSLISVYYYIGVLVRLYMAEGGAEIVPPSARPYLFATLLLAVLGTVAVGLFPTTLFDLARASFLSLSS